MYRDIPKFMYSTVQLKLVVKTKFPFISLHFSHLFHTNSPVSPLGKHNSPIFPQFPPVSLEFPPNFPEIPPRNSPIFREFPQNFPQILVASLKNQLHMHM